MSKSKLFYAVGDIHGDYQQLMQIISWIDADLARQPEQKDYQMIFVGDLIDRREQSKEVIDFLIRTKDEGTPITVLRGNHDRMFSMFFDNPHIQDPILRTDLTWLNPRLGGLTTLASYGVDIITDQDPDRLHSEATRLVPQAHQKFLRDLPNTYETDGYFFVHAGVNPELSITTTIRRRSRVRGHSP